MTNDYPTSPASLFAAHAREEKGPPVEYCWRCKRDTITTDGVCLWCGHTKGDEAERDAAESRRIAHWVGGEEPK